MQIVDGRRAPELARGEVLADFLLVFLVFRDRPACSRVRKRAWSCPEKEALSRSYSKVVSHCHIMM